MSDWDRDLEKFRTRLKFLQDKNAADGREDVKRYNEIQRQRRERGRHAIAIRRAARAKKDAEDAAKSAAQLREESEHLGAPNTSKIVQKAID